MHEEVRCGLTPWDPATQALRGRACSDGCGLLARWLDAINPLHSGAGLALGEVDSSMVLWLLVLVLGTSTIFLTVRVPTFPVY